ncbi:uncharacterized protein EV420DRAFT_1639479 [Desarmillaria tabescens]|uniref:Heterokaryon incompatibility domain-containing protein n=1 Tax=Armillaria tabescens TaxID=1929756 RepID=A0AA39NAX5_ARMTA|nr:uncharacterized protein EV420DRAFT_1639479 [Desarmillaria tabescens]KAK0462272.1 hypothetical protein EV420DRAFT_1639479 [Desarmillaria tabescens]
MFPDAPASPDEPSPVISPTRTRMFYFNYLVTDTKLTDEERWHRRYYDYIFPNMEKSRYEGDVLRSLTNETVLRQRQQIQYDHIDRCISGFHVYDSMKANQEGWAIPVLQQLYDNGKPVILSSLADAPCADLGVDGLLENFNMILRTEHPLTPSLSSFFKSCISKHYDFGTAYAHLRPLWKNGFKRHNREIVDRNMREEVIMDKIIVSRLVPPRRVWDLYSNRVVPWWIACQNPWAISHAWMDEKDRKPVLTAINGYKWPVPIPKDTDLDAIRIEMINLGAEYVWLDVLCLRQAGGEEENVRAAEWKVDVPTIGRIYEMAERVVYYFCGLGRPFTTEESGLKSDRSWFRRAWTLQEISKHPIIGGTSIDDTMVYEMLPAKFCEQLLSLEKIAKRVFEQTDVFSILSHMRDRVSTKPRDRIAGLAYLLRPQIIPAYYEAQSEEDAWTALVNVIAHDYKAPMLFLYPEPGNGNERWRPSWDQVMNGSLPSHNPYLLHDAVTWNRETNTNSYQAYFIRSALVRGLDREDKHGKPRCGDFIVKDRFIGRDHSFKIVAAHQHRIAEGWYTIFSSENRGLHSEDSRYWVCGRMRPGNTFEKQSVFQMPYFVDAERLRTLRMGEMSRVTLA